MSCRQDIIDVFEGASEHAVAIFAQSATVEQMDKCRCCWPEANSDAGQMAKLALQTYREYGIPTAHIPFSAYVESEAFGCTIDPGTRSSQPKVAVHKYSVHDVPELPDIDNYLGSDCIKRVIEAAGLVHENDVFTVTKMCAPSALVGCIAGMEEMIMCMISEPDTLSDWLAAVEPYVISYRDALSAVSDGIMFVDCGSTDLTPPDLFDRFIGGRLKSLFKGFDDSYKILHFCGDSLLVADKAAVLGEDVLMPEASRCRNEYVHRVNGKVLLSGCIDPINGLFNGTPDTVIEQATLSLNAGFHFISPECGVPPTAKTDNLIALASFSKMLSDRSDTGTPH